MKKTGPIRKILNLMKSRATDAWHNLTDIPTPNLPPPGDGQQHTLQKTADNENHATTLTTNTNKRSVPVLTANFGRKTWGNYNPATVLGEKRKTNRIIGLTFPVQDSNLGLEPGVLTVLPDGNNVEYSPTNNLFNDADVQYYACSVYISGMAEFEAWARRHDFNKIVVGGYHPTTFPNEFKGLAHKIVMGPCDEFFETVTQEEQVVKGITRNQRLPRYDLYDAMRFNQQIIPDKKPNDCVSSICTSTGCCMRCDFCCSPIMCDTIISKPIEQVKQEIAVIAKLYKPQFLFIRDENFPLQKDWKERLALIHEALPHTKLYLFASANTVGPAMADAFKANGVYMVCLGLEDITVVYKKNARLDEACRTLHERGIFVYLSFIVNPLKVVGHEAGKKFYGQLLQRFEELKPEMVCGNFLMPFPGTKLWDDYYHLVSKDDYKFYNSKSAFLIKNEVARQKMEFFMFYYQWKYFTSEFYSKNIRRFDTGDTLHQRFLELYNQFVPLYERVRDQRP